MTDFAASRFPALAAQDPIAMPKRQSGLGLSLALIPLPLGEVSMLLTAWLVILQV